MQADRSQMTQEWLETPLGMALLQQEARVVAFNLRPPRLVADIR